MNSESIKVELRYSGNNIIFKYICKSGEDIMTTSLKLTDYTIEYHRRHPVVIKNSKYIITFDYVEFYNRNSHIRIETNDMNTELKVSGELLDEVRDHLKNSSQRNISERENFVSSIEYNNINNNDGFEHYNINQVLNTGRPYNREVNERNEDPINTRNNRNNNPQGGYRKTRKRVKH